MVEITTFLQLMVAGITSGSIYGLVALAFTLTYTSTQVINFGQGEFVMLGAMLAVSLAVSLKFPVVGTILTIIVLVGLVGLLMEVILINPLYKKRANIISFIIGTMAIGLLLRDGSAMVWGKSQLFVPSIFSEEPIRIGGITLMPQNVFIVLATATITLGLWLFLEKTLVGMGIRATAFNRMAASLIGIEVRRLIILTLIISSSVAGMAGYFFAPIISASAYMGLQLSIKGFIAAVIGGMGNPFAAMVGGILLGVIEQLGAAYISSAYKDIISFLVMLSVLMVKPNGLFSTYDQ